MRVCFEKPSSNAKGSSLALVLVFFLLKKEPVGFCHACIDIEEVARNKRKLNWTRSKIRQQKKTPQESSKQLGFSLLRFTPECSHLLDSCKQRLSRRRVPGVRKTPHDVQYPCFFVSFRETFRGFSSLYPSLLIEMSNVCACSFKKNIYPSY